MSKFLCCGLSDEYDEHYTVVEIPSREEEMWRKILRDIDNEKQRRSRLRKTFRARRISSVRLIRRRKWPDRLIHEPDFKSRIAARDTHFSSIPGWSDISKYMM